MTDKEKYEKLRNAIRVLSTRTSVSSHEWFTLKNEPQFRENVLRRSALKLGEKLLEDRLLEVKEWDTRNESPYGATHIFQLRTEVLLADVMPGHFASQIDNAIKEGFLKAISKMLKIADIYQALGGYGPVQALAIRGIAQDLRDSEMAPK